MDIESFDILYSTSNTFFSSLINISQTHNDLEGKYSHVALLIKGDLFDEPIIYKNKKYYLDKHKTYIFESVFDTNKEGKNIFNEHFNGVQIREYDEVVSNYIKLNFKHIIVAKLKPEYRKIINNKMSVCPYFDRYGVCFEPAACELSHQTMKTDAKEFIP